MEALLGWSEKWLLKFHPGKCKVLEVGTRNGFNYKLDGHILDHVLEERDVGVLIDHDLKFYNHMLQKANKANSIMGIIRCIFCDLQIHG